MRLTPQAYFVICLVIAVAMIVLKPIYTKSYADVPNAFAPTHITIATTSPCEAYKLSASTNKIALDYGKVQEPFRFYTLDSSAHICALARNVITAPLTSLKLSANVSDMERIEFIAITMGSESFYVNRESIDSVLGNHSGDFVDFRTTADRPSSSTPKSTKSTTDTTATPRILAESQARSEKVDSRNETQILESSQTLTLDLSSYKLNASSEIINLYGSTIFDSIWLGFFYYFLSPPFLPLWLVCVLAWIALKPSCSRQNQATKYQELITLGLILALALILRLYHYDSFSLWGDELYSVGVVGYPDGDFASVFKDPGNPPFYNFLLKLWLHCFGYTSGAARSLSVVIGSLGVVGIYLLLRDHACENLDLSSHSKTQNLKMPANDSRVCDEKTRQSHSLFSRSESSSNWQGSYLEGNDCRQSRKTKSTKNPRLLIPTLGAFFYAISFVAIGAAHEVRGYVLELALLPFVFYFLLHFLKAPKISNTLGYVLLGAMVCNTHYFGAVMILAGFIASAALTWRATELSTEQKRKKLMALLLLDILIASSLMPFFAITAFSQALGDTSFNTWIPAPSLNGLLQFLPQAFGSSSGAFIFIVLLLLTPMLKNRFLNFCVIIIVLGVLLPFIASFIRPIYYPKYAIYATYAFMLALCATALVLFARKVAGKNASFLIALLVCIVSISLLDHRVQPIGVGDNTRAKFRFITLDSNNEAHKNPAQKPRIYIIDLHTAMATKQRQYEIYGFKPSAEFLRISVLELTQRHFRKGDILYIDSYFIDKPTMQAVLSTLSTNGARIQPIPFGIQEERDLKESQDFIYKVIF